MTFIVCKKISMLTSDTQNRLTLIITQAYFVFVHMRARMRVFRQVKNLLRKYNIQLQFSDTAANLNKNGSHKSW